MLNRSILVSLPLLLCPSADAAPLDLEFELREGIVYSRVADRELKLDAFVPKVGELRPAVLVVHGGAWRSGNRYQLRGYAKELAKRGFVCFAIDYRLAPDHKFPAQIDDCRSAVKWIRRHSADYGVDPKRLGAIGYSAGGHLVSLLGVTGEAPSEENDNADTRLQAVVAGGAPTDFRWFPDKGNWAKYWMGGNLDDAAENFQAASSAAFVDPKDPPMFFYNGTDDKLVPLIWTAACVNACQKAGVKAEWCKIENAGHLEAAADHEALSKAYEFLVTELMPETAEPQNTP